MVFIRPYQESDFEACAHIYTHLSPATCHMLVDDDEDNAQDDPSSLSGAVGSSGGGGGGKVVGYCIGCPDPNPAALVRLAYDPRKLLQLDGGDDDTHQGLPLPSQGWRATMHIDLLPAYQRRGWGRRLVDAYVRSVRASGADYGRGAWIGIAPDNAGVVAFYEKVGLRLVVAPPPSSSATGEGESGGGGGGDEEGIHMVLDIAKA
ncbi:Acyl-CoA N-acyltransferase [Apiospora hydei]|uniref:Acyl-CoA N-acyltransferase n=1 Tax=Apiospora hydei TaxID=1337664 RepID=A0ABR1UT91_9PEZI